MFISCLPLRIKTRKVKIRVEENNRYVNSIIYKSLFLLLFEIIICLVFFNQKIQLVLGLILGGGLSIVFFRLLYYNVIVAIDKPQDKAKRYMVANYFIRFTIAGLVLIFATKSSLFNLYTTGFALMNIKLTLYINNLYTLFSNRKEGKNGH